MYKNYSELGQDDQKNVDLYSVVEIANTQHLTQILSENEIVCINIHAEWCGPCKQTASSYSILAGELTAPGIAIVKYDYEKLSQQEKDTITGIPVYKIFFRGRQVDEVIGADLNEVQAKLKNVISKARPAGNSQSNNQGPQHMRNSIRPGSRPMQQESHESMPYQAQAGYNQPFNGQPRQPVPYGYQQG
jgi:thioredoxin 1